MKALGVIVAGGKSSRMGGSEKALIELAGTSLIERVYSRIRFQVDEVAINAHGDATRFSDLGLAIFTDILSVGTPLAGLHAALHHGKARGFDAVLTVPSDTPLLPLDLVRRLEVAGRGTGAAVACSMTRTHYLTGLWSTALAPVLETCIRQNNMRRVQDFVAFVHTAEVEWDIFPHDPFFNINTPEDLKAAGEMLQQ